MVRLPLLTTTAFLVVSVLALASPSSASAGEVSLVTHVFCDGSCRYMYVEIGYALRLQADAGEVNSVTITRTGNGFSVRDGTSPLRAGPGCTQVDGQTAACFASQLWAANIALGDGDDTLSVTGSIGGRPGGQGGESRIDGGPGDDRLSAGDGPETLDGGPGADEVHAGGGDDLLVANEMVRAPDTFEGGLGEDMLSYRESKVPVRIDLADRSATQGEKGERDAVNGVEAVVGGTSADTLMGDAAANQLFGGEGSDLVGGRGGDDVLFGDQGRDAVLGGPGDDSLEAQDGGADDVGCGSGSDRVGMVYPGASDDPLPPELTTVDPKDEISPDCERVQFISTDLEERLVAVAPLSVRAGAVSFGSICAGRRCRGEVSLRYGSRSRLAGRASFDQRSSRVVVALSAAAQRLLGRGRPIRISVRWRLVFPDNEYGDARYRTSYRTALSLPPSSRTPSTIAATR